MTMNEEEREAHYEDFKEELIKLIHKYSEVAGPSGEDEEVHVNTSETIPTDIILLVNWMDMDTSNGFLNMHTPNNTNPSMILGMLYRATNFID